MKIKDKDKIAYLVNKIGESSKFWKSVLKNNPKMFNQAFEMAKIGNTSSVHLSNNSIKIDSILPNYLSVKYQEKTEDLIHYEESFIMETAKKLVEYIKKFNLIGACTSIPYFYKLFMNKNNIELDVEFGIYESSRGYSIHCWNKYRDKLIDVTAFSQHFNVIGSIIILDQVIQEGINSFEYYRADRLPTNYIKLIEETTLLESSLTQTAS